MSLVLLACSQFFSFYFSGVICYPLSLLLPPLLLVYYFRLNLSFHMQKSETFCLSRSSTATTTAAALLPLLLSCK